MQMYKKLTKETVETLLNELFTLDREQNKSTIRNYMDQKNNLSLSKIVDFGQVKNCVEMKKKKKQTDMTKKFLVKAKCVM